MFEKYKRLAKKELAKLPHVLADMDSSDYFDIGYWKGYKEGVKAAERHIKKRKGKVI